jgi:transposase
MWRRQVELSEDQRDELRQKATRDPKPYRRERAVAILKVASGEVAAQVAAHGLLVPRDPDTVYGWLDRYQAEGVAGLKIRAGRGRKPTLSPPGECRAGGAARGLAAAARG